MAPQRCHLLDQRLHTVDVIPGYCKDGHESLRLVPRRSMEDADCVLQCPMSVLCQRHAPVPPLRDLNFYCLEGFRVQELCCSLWLSSAEARLQVVAVTRRSRLTLNTRHVTRCIIYRAATRNTFTLLLRPFCSSWTLKHRPM